MKAKVILLAMAMLALCRPADASWRVDTTELQRAKNISGRVPTLGPCVYATQSDCLNYIQELCRQWGVPEAAGLIKCVECGGSGGNSGGSLGQQMAQSVGDLISGGNSGGSQEQQMAGSLATAIVGSLFSKKQNTSHQAEVDKQNAIKLKQAEELEKQHQLQLQQEQELAQQKKFAEEKDRLLGAFKDSSSPTSELKFKTGTDFFQGDAVDLRGKQGIVGPLKTNEEQAEFENSPAEWKEKQGKLIQQRLEEPNKWCSGIQAHLMGNVPPLPAKTFDELQPGDVLLIAGEGKFGKEIVKKDNEYTSDKASDSTASHTVIFLKEVNGKKYFLDSQPALVNGGKGGPRIITDAEFLDTYGHRGTEIARMVGQPLNKEEGDKLFHAALEMAEKNRKTIANNFLGSGYFGTNWGVGGEDMVCSEADWALLNLAREKQIPKSGDQTKVEWGINWSPADFRNRQYFLVTPLIMPK